MRSREELLSGWGRTAPSRAILVETDAGELTAPGTLERIGVGGRGIIARGLGRSYGDPAQNGGGAVLRLVPDPGPLRLDPVTGTVTAGAGVSLDRVLRHIVPLGWFVPVTPGTRHVTVGGAIASDIHGKNHHVDGSFGRHLERFRLLLADGSVIELRHDDADQDARDLWVATIGGMGLTGVILDATFRLIPVETSRCLVDTERLPDLSTLLGALGEEHHRYSVAWVDLRARGSRLGRAVLTRAEHATIADLDEFAPCLADDPLAFDPPELLDVPFDIANMVPRPAVRAFNEAWYRKAPRRRRGIEGITPFFHILDMVGHWNRLYGRNGFLQYQFVVPLEATAALERIVKHISASGEASVIAVLKRFGAEGDGLLSFPRPGWTLTLDLPAAARGVGPLLATLDEEVLDAGGRHYLAKDAHATPEVIRRGYPGLARWRSIRARIDPNRRWVSDQARRLDLL